ncbi:hypothetical protein BGX27_006520 [Mortierella sp. AM989]|nr:hypothetical protein BGX27_006520 [Mortierella sp. AM989]
MKLLYFKAAALLACLASRTLAGGSSNEDDLRRIQIEPEFATLFTNNSYVTDPAYKKEVKELKEMMIRLGGPLRANNRVGVAAVSHAGHGKHYCVGYAENPNRARIFENRMDCDIEGWYTIASFCIPPSTVNTKSLPRIDGCVGVAHNPTRTMYFHGFSNCDRNGWTHAFRMTVQDSTRPHFLSVWEAFNPHRMTVSAGGADFGQYGWTYRNHIPAYTITYPITPLGLKVVKPHVPKVVSIHKRNAVAVLPTVGRISHLHLLREALEHLTFTSIPRGGFRQGLMNNQMRTLMAELGDSNVNIEIVRDLAAEMGFGFEANVAALNLVINNVVVGVIHLEEGITYTAAAIRGAFMHSLTRRTPITLFRAWAAEIGGFFEYLLAGIEEMPILFGVLLL